MRNHYTIFTRHTPPCSFCISAKELLTSKNLSYTEHVIGTDLTRDEFLEQFPDVKTVPLIILNGKIIGGFTALVESLKEKAET